MKNHFNSPIFVLGLPRSGTSMIAGSIGICGAWTGNTVPGGGTVNPKGFFEHIIIREHVIKRILTSMKCDPLGVRIIPPVDLQRKVPMLANIIKNIIEKDGYKHDRPWLYKDAKLTLLWPIFKQAFPNSTWVVVRRDEEGFINSCIRTHFMAQHSQNRDFWINYAKEYRIRLEALKNSGTHFLEISSPDVIAGNFATLKKLIEKLGLEYREKELKAFISPVFWHGNSNNTINSNTL